MSRTRRFLIYHLPMIVYAGIIIALSSIPHLRVPSAEIPGADKIAHAIEYGIFAFLVVRSFVSFSRDHSLTGTLTAAALFLVVFAVFDEYYQRTVPGREFDVQDMIADITGALLVVAILWIRKREKKRLADSTSENAP